MLYPGSSLENKGNHQTEYNNIKINFSTKKGLFNLLWVILWRKTVFLLHFKKSNSEKYMQILPR